MKVKTAPLIIILPKSTLQNRFPIYIWRIYFSRENWRKFKQEVAGAEENFKSPRNTAAGLINRDTPCDYLKYVSFLDMGQMTSHCKILSHI